MKVPVTKKIIKKILIAEDEKPYSRALTLKLKNAGFETDTAFDGEEAVSKLKNGNFDLLLLDLIMPKLNGFGVLEEIKKESIKVHIIVLSNLSQEEDKEKVKSLGAEVFLEKSITPIIDIINKIINLLK